MKRAIELARGPASTSPNPRVGAVAVRSKQIVAETAYGGPGTPHAEAALTTMGDLRDADVYVTLEPCSHHGTTPPCADALIEAGVARVVAAGRDPDQRVSGSGFAKLEAAGIKVTIGILEDEARLLNLGYLHQRATGRPLVTLKVASSLDGKFSASDGSSRWITGPDARRKVHSRRAEVDAVLTGSGTVIADDPALTARDVDIDPIRQPIPIVVDSHGRVAASAKIFERPGAIVATVPGIPHERETEWKEAGAEVLVLPPHPDGGVDLAELLRALSSRAWNEIYCEAGPRLTTSLIDEDLVDVIEWHLAPKLVGGTGEGVGDIGVGHIRDAVRFKILRTQRIGDDVILTLERRAGH